MAEQGESGKGNNRFLRGRGGLDGAIQLLGEEKGSEEDSLLTPNTEETGLWIQSGNESDASSMWSGVFINVPFWLLLLIEKFKSVEEHVTGKKEEEEVIGVNESHNKEDSTTLADETFDVKRKLKLPIWASSETYRIEKILERNILPQIYIYVSK